MWIITKCVNEYDQEGDYLVTVFNKRPSVNEITLAVGCDEKYANHIRENGGRVGYEHDWYYLTELHSGQIYEHHL